MLHYSGKRKAAKGAKTPKLGTCRECKGLFCITVNKCCGTTAYNAISPFVSICQQCNTTYSKTKTGKKRLLKLRRVNKPRRNRAIEFFDTGDLLTDSGDSSDFGSGYR